jgi:peptidoglycan hydrolase-like protein with peptidoglycan-binding domain
VRRIRAPYVFAGAAVAAVVIAVLASGVLGSRGKPTGGGADNTYPTSLQTVTRRSLSSQTQVSATLGYADPSTVVVPSGTSPSNLQQAQQAATTAQAQLATVRAALSADAATLAQVNASLTADRAKATVDCGGDNAGQSAAASSAGGGSGSGACATDAQAVSTGEQSATQAAAKVASDRQQVSSATAGLASAEASLAQEEASATVYGQSATYTELPAAGKIVDRGQTLFEIGGQPVVVLYGSAAPWRAFVGGMSPGKDVAELNANLRALGYGSAPSGDAFSAGTASAIAAFQAARGLSQTGELLLGSVVFERGAVRVTSVTPTLGATVQPGPVLGITSTVRQVTIALDAAQQSEIKVGDSVTITLPDNSTTPGRVSYVGTVATVPAGNGGGSGSSSPTIEVDVTPTDPAATGHLDQAPVNVSITTNSVPNALAVPVNALLALASGGYAVEAVGAGGVHHLVAVELGLFDDADGLVQVTGTGIAAGQRVVVPSE